MPKWGAIFLMAAVSLVMPARSEGHPLKDHESAIFCAMTYWYWMEHEKRIGKGPRYRHAKKWFDVWKNLYFKIIKAKGLTKRDHEDLRKVYWHRHARQIKRNPGKAVEACIKHWKGVEEAIVKFQQQEDGGSAAPYLNELPQD